MSATETFRRNLDYFLTVALSLFFIAFAVASVQWYRINGSMVETLLFPAVTDWTFKDWQLDDQGLWSAEVWVNKKRLECIYVKGQIETVLGHLPDGEPEESTVTHVGDTTPGSNRSLGYQKLDKRYLIDSPKFVKGTVFGGSILHRCHPGDLTVSMFGPFVVGVDSQDPNY